MKILKENSGQISAELILILSAMTVIVLITGNYTINVLNELNNHTSIVLKTGRNYILSRL
jgi:uncharacterized protein (UPF0333 family)